MALLQVRDLSTQFSTRQGVLPAVDRVTFHIDAGETLALVGESGCGKSVTAASIMRLVPDPPGTIAGGSIVFEDRDLLLLSPQDMRALRGSRIGMIFQDPMTSLNPVFTIGDQIAEVIRVHEAVSRRDALERVVDLLGLVGLPDPRRQIREFPHRLSGGMRQRVMIAMALACRPSLLIADEPTTALDVTTQAQVLELLDDLKRKFGMGILLITHDLGVVAQSAQRVVVMYAGRVVEEGTVEQLFNAPLHPYTKGLIHSLPRPEREPDENGRPRPLFEIPGMVPSLVSLPDGCRFAPRCDRAIDVCLSGDVSLELFGDGRSAACRRIERPREVSS